MPWSLKPECPWSSFIVQDGTRTADISQQMSRVKPRALESSPSCRNVAPAEYTHGEETSLQDCAKKTGLTSDRVNLGPKLGGCVPMISWKYLGK